MRVFGVYSGCQYEGGNIRALFSTREKAREYALAIIDNENFYANLNHQASQVQGWGHSGINSYKEVKPDSWEDDGSQVIDIIEYTVDELTPPFTRLAEERARSLEYHNQMMEGLKEDE